MDEQGTPDQRGTTQSGSDDGRITKLEEHLAFAEHTIDQLSQAIAAATASQRAIERRLRVAEARLDLLMRHIGGEHAPGEDTAPDKAATQGGPGAAE